MKTVQANRPAAFLARGPVEGHNRASSAAPPRAVLREVKVSEAKEAAQARFGSVGSAQGNPFREKITVWEEGRRYCYQPNADEAPFPFRWAEACRNIERDGEASRLTCRLRYQPRSRLADLINYPLLRMHCVRQIKKMLKSQDQSP